ncbi:MAG: hypothetical protein HZB38_13990 [Planctomycetes bacterium]|nr:hypothetical protein [Planctomycetota bacterium]
MLKELFSELESRRKDRETDFWATARKLAAGEKVTAAAVEKLLTESGKTPTELQAAVELMAQRAHWHEQRRKAAALEKEQAALRDRVAAEDKRLSAAEKAHADATAPFYARLDEIKAAISDASDARRNLIRTCPDPELKAELAAVTQRLIELRARAAALRERGELVKQADRTEEAADRMAEGLVPGARTTRIDEMRERAARARKVGQEALAALPGVQEEIAKVEREEEAKYERMAKP